MASRHRRGLRTEVGVSLTLVMVTAMGVLAAVLVRIHEVHLAQLRQLAARSLVADASSPLLASPDDSGIRWWTLLPDGAVTPRGGHALAIDSTSRELGDEALERQIPLLQAGRIWQPIRFAAPDGKGGVAVAWLPAAASGTLVAGLVLGAVAVFTAFGLSLLQRRLVRPLQRLAAGVRSMTEGGLDARVSAEGGVAETAEVAHAFNEMAESLAARTRALEKAVSELRESNQSLRAARDGLDRAERLAAVGQLAAGVAHEVGNPMGAMLAFLDLAGRDPSSSEEVRSHLAKASREGERVRGILRQLLDFSRPTRGAASPVQVEELCEQTLDLVRAQSRYAGIELAVEVVGEPPTAVVDRQALAQILLNLVLNAADALGPTGPRRIRIVVRGVSARLRAGEGAGCASLRRCPDTVEIAVEDSGPGIPAEHRERIFDPFFTTKPPGEGTGLGLSNALRLAEQLGGSLDLDADSEIGAVFVLRLPAQEDSATGVRS